MGLSVSKESEEQQRRPQPVVHQHHQHDDMSVVDENVPKNVKLPVDVVKTHLLDNDDDDCTAVTLDTEFMNDAESVGDDVLFRNLETKLPAESNTDRVVPFASAHNSMAVEAFVPQQQDYDQALYHYQKTLQVLVPLSSSGTADAAVQKELIRTRGLVAGILQRQHRYDAAYVQLSEALRVANITFGDTNALVAGLHEDLGILCNKMGGYEQSLREFRSALQIYHKITVPLTRILACCAWAGAACIEVRDYHGSIQECRKALHLFNVIKSTTATAVTRPEYHMLVGTTYNTMGIAYMNLKERDKALDCFHNAMSICQRFQDENHSVMMAMIYRNMGILYGCQQRFEEALEAHRASLRLLQLMYDGDENNSQVGAAYSNLGLVYHAQGDYSTALKFFFKASNILMATVGHSHSWTVKNAEHIRVTHGALAAAAATGRKKCH